MRDVVVIAQNQLKGVCSGFEFQANFGLARTEMSVVIALGNRKIRIGEFRIYHEVMVPRPLLCDARRCDAHRAEPKSNHDRRRYPLTI